MLSHIDLVMVFRKEIDRIEREIKTLPKEGLLYQAILIMQRDSYKNIIKELEA